MSGGSHRRSNEQACADDRSDPKQDQIDRAKMPLEGSLPLGPSLLVELFERLPRKNIHGGNCFEWDGVRFTNKTKNEVLDGTPINRDYIGAFGDHRDRLIA